MRALGFQWWAAAFCMLLLLAALKVTSVAVNAPLPVPGAESTGAAMLPSAVAQDDVQGAPERESVEPSAAPGVMP